MMVCGQCGAPARPTHRYCASCGAELAGGSPLHPEDPLIGTVLADHFVLRELIGSGGMGRVYRAEQRDVGRTVAVKIMHAHLLGDETAAARFTNEARAASSLDHPNSIAVLDFGRTRNGLLYIVMEHLRGESLDVVLRREFPLGLGRVASILSQALDAVEAAHHQNIIHRDLKPENIFIVDHPWRRDLVKVLDFGIAKMLDLQDRSVTTPGLVPGTPEYMSPEQARGEKLDPRSDVYSLGVILYELLTGSVPFRGASAVVTMMSHVQDPVVPPSQRRPKGEIPPSLEAIVLWALAKEPSDRISSAVQFRDVLSAWAHVAGVWPAQAGEASSPDVLLDFFSEDQLTRIPGQLSEAALSLEDTSGEPVERSGLSLSSLGDELVGRESVVPLLEQTISQPDRDGGLYIEGPLGIGKSRLIVHLLEMADQHERDIFRCGPDAGWTSQPLGAARRIARFCLQLAPGSEDAEAIRTAVVELGLEADALPGIEELFGLANHLAEVESAARRRERTAAFVALIQHAALRRRLLLVLEQVDRYDHGSQELIEAIVARRPRGVAMVLTGTPATGRRWSEKLTTLPLGPLPAPDAERLVQMWFAHGAGDGELCHRIVEAAGGHPLFLQQMALAAAHDGLRDPPERLPDLVAWRLERLEHRERQLLQWLAVYNRAASAEQIAELSAADCALETLERLAEQGFLAPVTPSVHRFFHPLLAMVAYSSIPAEVRREMHRRVAEQLRQAAGSTREIAHHAFEADGGPRAIEELDAAASDALRCLDERAAIAHYTHALHLVRREWGMGRVAAEDLDKLAVDLALRLARTLVATGDALTAEGVLEEALSVSAADDAARARLRLERGRIDIERGNLQRAVQCLELAQGDAKRAESSYLLGEIGRETARAWGLLGERSRAGRILFEALEHSTRAGGKRHGPAWSALLAAAKTALQLGFGRQALDYLHGALQRAERSGALVGRVETVCRIAEVHQSAGQWAEAERYIAQGLELVAQLGDRSRRVRLLVALGRLRRVGADMEGAERHLERAIELGRAIDYHDGIRTARAELELVRSSGAQSAL